MSKCPRCGANIWRSDYGSIYCVNKIPDLTDSRGYHLCMFHKEERNYERISAPKQYHFVDTVCERCGSTFETAKGAKICRPCYKKQWRIDNQKITSNVGETWRKGVL